LAGVLLKIGGYSIWRFSDSLRAPLATKVGVIAVSGGAMARLIALCQVDIKSLIAYSRVVHMGLVVYGLIVFSFTGVVGALIMIVAHGVRSSGLFCLATFRYERFNTRSLIVGRGSILIIPSLSLL
jgi:NADH-ubiquinone oxidoreductase chain 4